MKILKITFTVSRRKLGTIPASLILIWKGKKETDMAKVSLIGFLEIQEKSHPRFGRFI
jgi:hypothetical protein